MKENHDKFYGRAFDLMHKYGISSGRNDAWHTIVAILTMRMGFIIPIYAFYFKHIKVKFRYLDNLYWRKCRDWRTGKWKSEVSK